MPTLAELKQVGEAVGEWTFRNRIHTTLADFHEQDLAALTERMGHLPTRAVEVCDSPKTGKEHFEERFPDK